MRASLLRLALPAAIVASSLASTAPALAVDAPGVPTGATQFATLGGGGLTWNAAFGGEVTGYRVAKSGTEVANITDLTGPLTYVDTDLAAGAEADYTVVAYGPGGSSPAAEAHVARPASDPAIGTGAAFVLEGDGKHFYMDAARAGDTVTLPSDVLTGTVAGTTRGTSTLPVVKGPGTYILGQDDGLLVNIDSNLECRTGTITVTSVAFDADLHPLTYAADLTGQCMSGTFRAALRWASDVPYVGALLSTETVTGESDLNTTSQLPLTITNKGLAPFAVGAPTVSGNDAAQYSATSGTCTGDLAPEASCSPGIGFTPTGYGTRPAYLHLDLGSTNRRIDLAGIGGHVPSAVTNVTVTHGFHRNLLTWSAPSSLGTPAAVSYRVYKGSVDINGKTSFGSSTTVFGTSFVDASGVTPGLKRPYRIVAVNDAGPGAVHDTPADFGADRTVLITSPGPGVAVGLYMLSQQPGETGRVPFLADATPRYSPAVSPDGRQVVYAQAISPSTSAATDLYITTFDGTQPTRRLTSLTGTEYEPSWSPDGKTIAFTYYTDTTAEVRTVPAAGGTSVRRTLNMIHPSWLADSTRIVAEPAEDLGLFVLDATGKATPIAGTADGFNGSVSPDGSKIAFATFTTDDYVHLAVVPVAGGTPQVLNDPGKDWYAPTWRPDGLAVIGERWSGEDAHAATALVGPAGLSAPTDIAAGQAGYSPVHVQGKIALTQFAPVTGRNVTFTYTPPFGSWLTCSLDGAAAAHTGCGQYSFTRTGMTPGKHRLVVRAYSGEGGPLHSVMAAEWTVDGTAPTVSITSPATHTASVATTLTVGYKATDTGIGVQSYDVRYRRATSNGGYGAYTSPTGWLSTTATSRALTVSPGYDYCFSVRARDKGGNLSAWTGDRCVAVALDDRSLTASAGWTRASSAGSYKSTVTSTTRTGVSLTRAVQARRVTLVVTRCATCGPVDVYIGATKVGRVDTRAASTQKQVKLTLPLLASVKTGTLSLKPVTAGKQVIIDGVALGRT